MPIPRIAILGNSGSGKSALARALAAPDRIPVLDLDAVAWEADQPAVPREEEAARKEVAEFCGNHERWIVEGCYTGLIEEAISHEGRLIFLNPGEAACLANCRSRPWEPHKYPSKEAQDANLAFLLSWVSEYYSRDDSMSLTAHRKLFDTFIGPKLEITSLPDLLNAHLNL